MQTIALAVAGGLVVLLGGVALLRPKAMMDVWSRWDVKGSYLLGGWFYSTVRRTRASGFLMAAIGFIWLFIAFR